MAYSTPSPGAGTPRRPFFRRLSPAAVVAVVIGLVILGIGLLIALFVAFVLVTAPWNPMVLAFIATFEMYNDSGVDVWVTPIGMCEGSGEYGPLPRYRDRYPPALWSRQDHDVPLEAGDSVRITYDMDDINFRHILVRTGSEDVFILDTDKMGDRHSCYGPQQDAYGIPPLDQLEKAPAELLPCAKGESVSYSGMVEYSR